MKTEEMTPRWVVENFLPDYEQKMLDALNARPSALVYDIRVGFIERYFPEALSELLKAQRDECATICGNAIDFHPVDVAGQVFNAPIPEPKNRK